VKNWSGQAAIYPVYLCSLADLFKGSELLLHLYRVVKLYPLIGMGSTRTGSDIERGQPASRKADLKLFGECNSLPIAAALCVFWPAFVLQYS
jgi:hypothetical protein